MAGQAMPEGSALLQGMLLPMLLTVLIETPLFFACGFRRPRQLLWFAAVNAMTSFGESIRANLPGLMKSGLEIAVGLSQSIRDNAGDRSCSITSVTAKNNTLEVMFDGIDGETEYI